MTSSEKTAPIPDGKCPLCGGRGRAEKVALTLNEAMHALSIGRTHLYDLIHAGKLRAVKCGKKRTLILVSDLEAFLAALQPLGGTR